MFRSLFILHVPIIGMFFNIILADALLKQVFAHRAFGALLYLVPLAALQFAMSAFWWWPESDALKIVILFVSVPYSIFFMNVSQKLISAPKI